VYLLNLVVFSETWLIASNQDDAVAML